MTAVGDTDGLLVCVRYEPPLLASRWCRWFGHSDVVTTGRRGARVEYRRMECQRCGREESWWDRRDYKLPNALAHNGLTEEQIAAVVL